jgi:hypothetical protein
MVTQFSPTSASTLDKIVSNPPEITDVIFIGIQDSSSTVLVYVSKNGYIGIKCSEAYRNSIDGFYYEYNGTYIKFNDSYDTTNNICIFYYDFFTSNVIFTLFVGYLSGGYFGGFGAIFNPIQTPLLPYRQFYELVLVDSTGDVVTSVVNNSNYTYKWKCKLWDSSTYALTGEPFTSEELFTGTFVNNYSLPTGITSTGITASYNDASFLINLDVGTTCSFLVQNSNPPPPLIPHYFAFSQAITLIDEPQITTFSFTENYFITIFNKPKTIH